MRHEPRKVRVLRKFLTLNIYIGKEKWFKIKTPP